MAYRARGLSPDSAPRPHPVLAAAGAGFFISKNLYSISPSAMRLKRRTTMFSPSLAICSLT